MATSTVPLLSSSIRLAAGESIVLGSYRGIRVTIVPDQFSSLEASYVNSEQDTVHDPSTLTAINAMTFIEMRWPFLLVSCISGGARVAIV